MLTNSQLAYNVTRGHVKKCFLIFKERVQILLSKNAEACASLESFETSYVAFISVFEG